MTLRDSMRHQPRKMTMTKPNDYRKWSREALDAAIMYQVQYGSDLQKLDRLIAARGYKEPH